MKLYAEGSGRGGGGGRPTSAAQRNIQSAGARRLPVTARSANGTIQMTIPGGAGRRGTQTGFVGRGGVVRTGQGAIIGRLNRAGTSVTVGGRVARGQVGRGGAARSAARFASGTSRKAARRLNTRRAQATANRSAGQLNRRTRGAGGESAALRRAVGGGRRRNV